LGKDGTGQGKSKSPVAAHHRGIGSVDIRNFVRTQLMVSWHPEVAGLRVVTHAKHNLSEEGSAFGYRFDKGQFRWQFHIPGSGESQSPPTESPVYRGDEPYNPYEDS
jgi:hypothetical protein